MIKLSPNTKKASLAGIMVFLGLPLIFFNRDNPVKYVAREIPCAADEISLTKMGRDTYSESWLTSCRGITYKCTYFSGADMGFLASSFSCKPISLTVKREDPRIKIGMTTDEFIAIKGHPQAVNKDNMQEQWVYGDRYYYFIDGRLANWN